MTEMLELARRGDLGCRRVHRRRRAGARSGAWRSCSTSSIPSCSWSAETSPPPATCCSTACASRSPGCAARPGGGGQGDRAGVLGDRAQVLGALALVVSRGRRAFPTRLAVGGVGDMTRVSRRPDRRRNPCVIEHEPLRLLMAAFVVSAMVFVAACGGDDDNSGSSATPSGAAAARQAGKVAVLLPDSKSSVRWETVDRPFLKKAFDAAGVEATIQNAEGDKSTQQQQAEQAITNGAKVLLLVNLDSGSGAAIAANAKRAGRQGHRLRPPDAQRRLRLLRLVRQREGRQAAGRGPRQVPVQGRRGTPNIAELNGSPDRQQRHAVQEGLRLGPEAEVRRRARSRRSPTSRCRTGTTRRR